MEERPDAQKQILVEIAKKLPIFTRAQSGGRLCCHMICIFSHMVLIHLIAIGPNHWGEQEDGYMSHSLSSRMQSVC